MTGGKIGLVLEKAYPVYRPRNWGRPSRTRALARPWFGLDTERDSHSGEFVCGVAAGETVDRFTRMDGLGAGTYFVWNLAYDIEGMLRDLDLPEAWAAKIDGAEFSLLGGKGRYFHGKKFSLQLPGKKLSFVEASSFYNRCPSAKIGRAHV